MTLRLNAAQRRSQAQWGQPHRAWAKLGQDAARNSNPMYVEETFISYY